MESDGGYSVVKIKRRDGVGYDELLMRDCGDYVEATTKQPLINNDAFAAAASGEKSDELPRVSFSVPAFFFKFPKQFDLNDAERDRVMVEANKESLEKYKSLVTEAYIKARDRYMKEHNISMDQLRAGNILGIKEEKCTDQVRAPIDNNLGMKEDQLRAPIGNNLGMKEEKCTDQVRAPIGNNLGMKEEKCVDQVRAPIGNVLGMKEEKCVDQVRAHTANVLGVKEEKCRTKGGSMGNVQCGTPRPRPPPTPPKVTEKRGGTLTPSPFPHSHFTFHVGKGGNVNINIGSLPTEEEIQWPLKKNRKMDGGYYVIGIVDRPSGSGGSCKIVRRVFPDHLELAPVGVFFQTDGSVMLQEMQKNVMTGCNELRLTWVTREAGAVELPPVICKIPKAPPQNMTNYDSALRQALDEAKKEALVKFYASTKEARAKYGINSQPDPQILLNSINNGTTNII